MSINSSSLSLFKSHPPEVVMAGAWHGGLKGAEDFVKSADLRAKISLAMDYWFGRDVTNLECLINGGTATCPCSDTDTTLWYAFAT